MENLKQELLALSQNWNASGEFDGTRFEGRFFIDDTDLDDFAAKHDMTEKCHSTCFCRQDIEQACDCLIVCNYESANPNRQFGDQEVIFNEKAFMEKN